MPAKSNVRKGSNKSGGFKFSWWMGLGLVVVVALVGVLVLRFSQAAIQPCGQAQRYQLCDAGPIRLKVLSKENNNVCGEFAQINANSRMCGYFNNQFHSQFYYYGGNGQDDKNAIFKLNNSFNTTCGRISDLNPISQLGTKSGSSPGDPRYKSPREVFEQSVNFGASFWWTSVGC